ncbi:PAS domain-containing protein [Actinoplanes campanulatus]|uniref:PAS domain-containing protein n=3 Tax=Actinoplanes campanulatus TaxID=113559 RepID=A0A7W5AIC0_9ACTN|nr:PAS domain-containing protein [Actinoplanes campanulatus]
MAIADERGVEPDRMDPRSGGLRRAAADHLMTLMAQATQAPAAMVHLLDGEQLRLVGGYGLPSQWASTPPASVSSTLSALVIARGSPVVISDVTADAQVPAEAPESVMGERAYLGYPIRDADGAVTGVCAVLDHRPRPWQPEHLTAVAHGAKACAVLVIEQRSAVRADEARRLLVALMESLQTGVAACDTAGRLVFSNKANQDLHGELPEDVDLRAWTRQRLASAPDVASRPWTAPAGPRRRAPARHRNHGRTPAAATFDAARRRTAHHQRRRRLAGRRGHPAGCDPTAQRSRAEGLRADDPAPALRLRHQPRRRAAARRHHHRRADARLGGHRVLGHRRGRQRPAPTSVLDR